MPVNPIVLMYAYIKGIAPSAKYIPITLTNSQSSITPTPFQQLINIDPSTIGSSYFSSDLGNIRFYADLAFTQPLYAWVESGNSNTSTSTNIWVNLPNGIPANSSITIYMELLSVGTEYDGVYMGEAPQLSPTYAQYDNGENVFNNYWNFAGTSLPSGWGGSGYTVNNGVTIGSANGDYVATTSSTYGLNPNYILDYYGTFPSNPNISNAWFGYTTYDDYTNFVAFDENSYSGLCGSSTPIVPYSQINGTGQTPYDCSGALPAPQTGVFSVYFASSTLGGYFFNYASRGSYSAYPNVHLSIGGYNLNSQIAIGPFNWVRVRAYPPNGVMPSVSIGSIA